MPKICILLLKIHDGNHELVTYASKKLEFLEKYVLILRIFMKFECQKLNLTFSKNGNCNPIFTRLNTIGGVREGQTSLLPKKFSFRNPKNPAYLPPLPKILAKPLFNTTRILEKNPNFCLKFRPDTLRAGPARIF